MQKMCNFERRWKSESTGDKKMAKLLADADIRLFNRVTRKAVNQLVRRCGALSRRRQNRVLYCEYDKKLSWFWETCYHTIFICVQMCDCWFRNVCQIRREPAPSSRFCWGWICWQKWCMFSADIKCTVSVQRKKEQSANWS